MPFLSNKLLKNASPCYNPNVFQQWLSSTNTLLLLVGFHLQQPCDVPCPQLSLGQRLRYQVTKTVLRFGRLSSFLVPSVGHFGLKAKRRVDKVTEKLRFQFYDFISFNSLTRCDPKYILRRARCFSVRVGMEKIVIKIKTTISIFTQAHSISILCFSS